MAEIHPFASEHSEKWDRLVEASPETWFWHTSEWMGYTLDHRKGAAENLSFFLVEGGEWVGGCVLFLDQDAFGSKVFVYNGEPLPAPFVAPELTDRARQNVFEKIFERVDELARELGVAQVRFQLAGLAYQSDRKFNPLVEHGYMDTTSATSMMELKRSEEDRWRGVSKGHKHSIKKADKELTFKAYDHQSIQWPVFDEYRKVHKLDCGYERPLKTFESQYRTIEKRQAVLFQALRGEESSGFVYSHIYKNRAFYSSSCRHPNEDTFPVNHFLLWRGMNWLADQGVELFEIGCQEYPETFFRTLDGKGLTVSAFKRGFGGTFYPYYRGEKFYSAQHAERLMSQRLNLWMDHSFSKKE